MWRKEKGIFLHQIKHTDSKIIAQIFCEKAGYQSLLIRRSKNLKSGMLQPFSILEMDVRFKENEDLGVVREIKRHHALEHIHTDVRKSAQAMFLAEVLYRTLQRGYQNQLLFDNLERSILFLDHHPFASQYHLWFLKELLFHYGIMPEVPSSALPYFNLLNGEFSSHPSAHSHTLESDDAQLLQRFLGMDFDTFMSFDLSPSQRKILMDVLLGYMMNQISGFNQLNSRDVFEAVFSH